MTCGWLIRFVRVIGVFVVVVGFFCVVVFV